jgi:5-methylthioadenosine/S-adenosylhomocysteine deaminase
VLLIRDADYVITLDARRRILEHHSILIEGKRITDIGPSTQMDSRHLERCRAEGAVLEGRGRLVIPGYVNTHVHTFEHLSRGLIPDDLSTFAWGATYARPFYASLTEDEAYVAARLACLEMLRSGTTCFVDVTILVSLGHLDAVAQAVSESGMRAVLGRGVFDLMPQAMAAAMTPALQQRVLSPSAGAALGEVAALLDRWTSTAGGRIRAWASIYGLFPYCSDELFAGLRAVGDR